MTESDKLLSKADALLARWRSGAVVRPPSDYPVLTEVVTASTADNGTRMPEIPAEPDIPVLDSPAARAADAVAQALEERVRLRVLEAVEPYIRAFLAEHLRLRFEQLAQGLAEDIAKDARNDILTLVRDAVQSAVARELDARRDERSGSR